MNVIGKDAGRCIHCYEYQNKRECSIALKECIEGDEGQCLDFIPRQEPLQGGI